MWSRRKRYPIHAAEGVEWTLVFDGGWVVEEVVQATGGQTRTSLAAFEDAAIGKAIAPFLKDAIDRAANDAG